MKNIHMRLHAHRLAVSKGEESPLVGSEKLLAEAYEAIQAYNDSLEWPTDGSWNMDRGVLRDLRAAHALRIAGLLPIQATGGCHCLKGGAA